MLSRNNERQYCSHSNRFLQTGTSKFQRRKILKTIHKRKGLEPSIHPFFSIQRLQYVDEMSYKLECGIQEVKFHEIYDEWVKILRERGV